MKNTTLNVPVAGFSLDCGTLNITPSIDSEHLTDAMCQGYAIQIVRLLRKTLPSTIYEQVQDQMNNWNEYHPYSDKDILDFEERIAAAMTDKEQ